MKWKPVLYWDDYSVSDNGEIKRNKDNKILKQYIQKNGYSYVYLNRGYGNKSIPVHRIVAEAFIPNPDNKPFVDHIDTNRSNNNLNNLRWATEKENSNNPTTLINMSKSHKKMNNQEKIEELKTQRNEAWRKINNINEEITRLEIEDYDYTGKYIYMPEHGYMYVTWQTLDTSHNIYSDDRMFFQGYSFTGCTSDYRDDYYIEANALEEWYVPINEFKDYVGITKNAIHPDEKIQVITKEEFIKAYNDMITVYNEDWLSMLEHCEKKEVHGKEDDE